MKVCCAFLFSLLALAAGCPAKERRRPDVSAGAGAKLEPGWPSLPWAADRAAALIQAQTRRKTGAAPAALKSAAALLALLKQRQRERRLVAGWPAVLAWLQARLDAAGKSRRDAYLLWGTYHDSGVQVAAFRRVIGPQGLRGLTAVTAEQYTADGRWGGLPPARQRGDSAHLARYLKRGDRAELQALRRGQLEHDYTAWKYRYLHEVLDLAVTARAAGLPLSGCDMPQRLQRRLYRASEMPGHLPRLRELHCLLALPPRAPDRPRRVAMLWGQEHVAPSGLPRFLPRSARVTSVYVVGRRPGPHGLEFGLGAAGLRAVDPLLVPLTESPTEAGAGAGGMAQAALILPGRATRARLFLARDTDAKAKPGSGVLVESSVSGKLWLGGHGVPLTAGAEAARQVRLGPGEHAFVLEAGKLLLTGRLQVPRRGSVELSLLPDQQPPAVQITLRGSTTAATKREGIPGQGPRPRPR
jgi:hypothetical protein